MNNAPFNTVMTLKSLAFISDSKLRQILADILLEIDNIALIGASRSTLYLSMSTLEGILTKLIEINLTSAKQYFPKNKNGNQKKLNKLDFDEKIVIARDLNLIEKEYYEIFQKMKDFRNYMHPLRELKNGDSIDLGIGQISLGLLNHIISKLGNIRFIQGQSWEVVSGEPMYDSISDTIDFRKSGNDTYNFRTHSFIKTDGFANQDLDISFELTLPSSGLLNFVYNIDSDVKFCMLRLDARNRELCGFLRCEHYAEWEYTQHFEGDLKVDAPNIIKISYTKREIELTLNGVRVEIGTNYPRIENSKQIGMFNEESSVNVGKLLIKPAKRS